VVVAKEFRANPPVRTVNVHEVAADEMILDVGPAAVEALADVLKNCRTLVWNGPLGAFETPPFDTATVALASTAAALTRDGSLVSVAGGGDTVAALNQAGVRATSPSSRPPAARSSNGWKARNCPGWPR
jgi:phosphoglycerate kinase